MTATMTGRVVNLASSSVSYPDTVIVDSSVIVELLVTSLTKTSSLTMPARYALQFFESVRSEVTTALVTPAVIQEVVHFVVKYEYQRRLRQLGSTIDRKQLYGVPIRDWIDLYKADASILREAEETFQQLRETLSRNNLVFVSLEDFPIADAGRSFIDEVLHTVVRYGLDAKDALVLMEARRCGVFDIVSFDKDLQRARADFSIYTWI